MKWQIKFKVKDKRLYGKSKSTVSNVNVVVETEALAGAWLMIASEIDRITSDAQEVLRKP